ncbi:MAG: hypothetical protein IKO32_12330 [Lachnospiraceae bacterium]|nr:hypothetical protein [Lachnospiraceae bacterium]
MEKNQNENQGKNNTSFKQYFKNIFSLKEDVATHEEIRDRLLSGGKITGTNMVVMICAMLISPLMGSILAMAYGTASNNFQL